MISSLHRQAVLINIFSKVLLRNHAKAFGRRMGFIEKSRVLALSGVIVFSFATACRQVIKLDKSSPQYKQAVSLFYVGLAALQVGDDVRAESKLSKLTQSIPDEPAGWINWGVLALRQRNFDPAAQRFERARSLDPDNDQIYYLIGLLESERGRSNEAIAGLRKATELNPRNIIATYKLAEEIERQGDTNSEKEFQQLIQQILKTEPGNLAALVELARMAAKRGDAETLREALIQVSKGSSAWPEEVKQQLSAAETAVGGPDLRAAATRIAFLRNVLVRVPEFRRSLALIKPEPGEEARPFTKFVLLDTPTFAPAPPDTAVKFNSAQIKESTAGPWNWVGAIFLNGEGKPTVVTANQRELRVGSIEKTYNFPGGLATDAPGPDGVLPIDFNYDFKTDLVLTGPAGIRFLQQTDAGMFNDVTAQTKLPATIINGNYTGSWAADIEADGDLDIVLGTQHSLVTVLRNNGDGSFTETHPFASINGALGFAWADLDGDGDPDAALIDEQNKLHVFENERAGQFKERGVGSVGPVKAINVADVSNDGIFDLIAVQADGRILRLSDKNEGQDFEIAEIARLSNPELYDHRIWRLRIADLDNNGSNDLLLTFGNSPSGKNSSGAVIWLSDEQNRFIALEHPVGLDAVFDAADLNGDGRLDLIGLTKDGLPVEALNQGSKNYHWQVIRPRAAKAVGDQRINSFGIGGDMEVRSGLLLQKQPVTGPVVHFGLGDQSSIDVVRIVWPNGSVRAEFELQSDQTIVAEQRLKGSCPFLFAYNGHEMKFVKDAVPWGSAIGLRINTLGTARVEATEEWYKIRGDELVPHDGYYDLRITGELWETYYYDQLGLMVVDHPTGTEIFVDERFVIPPARLAITSVETPRPVAKAWDDTGTDVTETISKRDDKYLDTFGRGRYQGVTRDHYVELDLGENVPAGVPLYLIAQGWMHPTDSSINVALSQGQSVQAKPISLEVPDANGVWHVAQANAGFPAGRKKICLFDLTNIFLPGAPHRVRLRTTLEVYWDCIQWAVATSKEQLRTVRLAADSADLHYRGYSVVSQANDSSPEIPDYNKLSGSKQRWRDLIGYYTRFGDVRELLAQRDDRYVIMNSGDEMSFRFREQPPPQAGWTRDYIIFGDGWIKDGDYNSTFSKTVLPLPYHEKTQYISPPTRLEDEWVYRQHPEDWQTYQTRYVTPAVFQNALR